MTRRRENMMNTFQSDDQILKSLLVIIFLILLLDFFFYFSISSSCGFIRFWTTCFEDSLIDVVVNPVILFLRTSASILLLTVLYLQLMLMGIETWRREKERTQLFPSFRPTFAHLNPSPPFFKQILSFAFCSIRSLVNGHQW